MTEKLYIAAANAVDSNLAEIQEYELSATGSIIPTSPNTAHGVMYAVAGREIGSLQFSWLTARLYFMHRLSGTSPDWRISYLLSGQVADKPPLTNVVALGSDQNVASDFVLLRDDRIWVPTKRMVQFNPGTGIVSWPQQSGKFYGATGTLVKTLAYVNAPTITVSPANQPNPLLPPFWATLDGKIRCFRSVVRADLQNTPADTYFARDLAVVEFDPATATVPWPNAITEVGRMTFERAGNRNVTMLGVRAAIRDSGAATLYAVASTRGPSITRTGILLQVAASGAVS